METLQTKPTDAELDAMLEQRQQEKIAKEKQEREAYLELREQLVLGQIAWAIETEAQLREGKKRNFEEFAAFAELVRKHENKKNSWKNNFELKSKDGNYKVVYARQQLGEFDERRHEALDLIKKFLDENLNALPAVKKLIEKLLEHRNGSLDIKLVQKLFTMENDFQDENWKQGINLLKNAWVETDSCDYIRYYQKTGTNKWTQIKLDFASA